MAILTPTAERGATTKPNEMLYVPLDRRRSNDDLKSRAGDALGGLNAAFLLDVMSGALAHERCGRHLYRSVAARTNNPMLKRKYEQYGEETERHVERLEELITAVGGEAQYVSPLARAVEKSGTGLVQSTFLLSGSTDVMTQEMVMLDAVFLAESLDHANWQQLAQVATKLPDGSVKQRFVEVVDEVEAEEDDHLRWAHDTRSRMTALQIGSTPMATAAAKAEEMVERVQRWLE